MKYDRLTSKIIQQVLKEDSNCVDVGAHKGEILDLFIKYAPKGNHTAFEPIPSLFNDLKEKYIHQNIFPYALSETSGLTTFQFVKNAPAYSGIKKRKYEVKDPTIETLNVEMKTLDEIISPESKIDLIKIDVEGGEFDVLKGAKETIKNNEPVIIFECGKGASDFYGTEPTEIFDFMFNELKLKISTLSDFLNKQSPLTKELFCLNFNQNKEYYFIAN